MSSSDYVVHLSSLQGYFFNQEDSTPGLASQVQDEVLASETGSLGLLEENRFQPIHTAWIALLQLILFVSTKYVCKHIIIIAIKNVTNSQKVSKKNFYLLKSCLSLQ